MPNYSPEKAASISTSINVRVFIAMLLTTMNIYFNFFFFTNECIKNDISLLFYLHFPNYQ